MELAVDRSPRDDLKLAGGNQCRCCSRTAELGRAVTGIGEAESSCRSDRRGGA